MSGGFFRGTSADQDTRFSNKQAKLLKTQKFAPELDHLVDMTKVKMDVMRPWIANRVTELLGFEDEVLINFIYGLLDGKDVNGKEVQISLTGFMEKNTAKFMKELWTLLLSAQKNASGVPQQFLDAKEEETRKKKLEADRIADEIQKKKENENREFDQERLRNMDGAVQMKTTNSALDSKSKTMLAKDEKEAGARNGVRGRNRVSRSPRQAARSPSSHRGSPSRSISKSHSNSRSYSDDRRKSRSVSRSPKARRHSISPRRRSITPHRRHSPQISRSPSRRSSYFRQRSRSRSPRRSPSPLWHKLRSPFRRKSPLPLRRRSPAPVRRRRSPSPLRRRRSPSPVRRRRSPSPVRRRRSPSPVRRRRSPSPVRRRRSPSPARRQRSPSPVRHRRSPLPTWHRSPSPARRWSRSPALRRSPSPLRRGNQRLPLTPQNRSPSPIGYSASVPSRMRSPTPSQRMSASPSESISPPHTRHRSPSPVRRKSPSDGGRLFVHSPSGKNRTHEKLSSVAQRRSSSLRSPQRDPKGRKDLRKMGSAFSHSPEISPTVSESPLRLTRKRSTSEDRRSFSPDESPVRLTREGMAPNGSISPSPRSREQRLRQDDPEASIEDKETNRTREDGDHKSMALHGRSVRSSTVSKQKGSPRRVHNKEVHSPVSAKLSGRGVRPKTSDDQRSPTMYEDSLPGKRQWSTYRGESQKSEERNRSHKSNGKESDRHSKSENAMMEVKKVDQNNRSDVSDSGLEQIDKSSAKSKEKRKHKKYDREEVASDDDYSYDSEIKESKRRRKEEKKLRREEKRRRRDERRRRREERRAEKLKMKNQSDADASDGEHIPRREYHSSDDEETEPEQKRLEIELRNRALESIKAKRNRSR